MRINVSIADTVVGWIGFITLAVRFTRMPVNPFMADCVTTALGL